MIKEAPNDASISHSPLRRWTNIQLTVGELSLTFRILDLRTTFTRRQYNSHYTINHFIIYF